MYAIFLDEISSCPHVRGGTTRGTWQYFSTNMGARQYFTEKYCTRQCLSCRHRGVAIFHREILLTPMFPPPDFGVQQYFMGFDLMAFPAGGVSV